jgi:hypothetical protein
MPVALGVFSFAIAPMARASFVSGQFAPGATSVEVTGTELLFYNLGIPPVVVPSGTFVLDAPATGSFASLVGDTASIKDLTDLSSDPSCVGCIFAPVDTSLASNIFMQLPATGTTIDIELTGISAGQDTVGTPICSTLTAGQLAASGTQCTPAANSPFILQNVFNSATGQINTNVNFSASGLAWFTATPTQESMAAINFSTSFTNESIGIVLSSIQTNGNVVGSLQGDIVVNAPSTIPEPGTGSAMLLAGAGLVGLSRLRRPKKF